MAAVFNPRAPVAAEEDLKEISWQEVAKHSDESDAWLVIHGRVYAVSSFLDDHPGGSDTLWQMAGADASTDWDAVGHTSRAAADKMKELLVGKVVGEKPKKKRASVKPKVEPMAESGDFNKVLALVLAFVALFAAYMLG